MSSIEEILAPFKSKRGLQTLKKELQDFAKFSLLPKKLSSEVAELGLLFLNKMDSYYVEVDYGGKLYKSISEKLPDNVWDDKKYYKLLEFFFGSEVASMVKKAWDRMPTRIYQSGYYRRSFRAPHQKNYVLLRQINFIRNLLNKTSLYTTDGFKYYDLDIPTQIRYSNDVNIQQANTYIWSELIDAGNTEIYQLMEDIVFGKDPVGKVSGNLVRALLNSNSPKAWELAGKLLLAAQRQEGLRQTILETLDETSVGALRYMIKMIIDEKLARFSSVVRAVDTWTGLGWEAEKETTVRNILSFADQFLGDKEAAYKGLESKNNNEVYMALWSIAVSDVDNALDAAEKILEKGTIEKKCLALQFVGETGIYEREMSIYAKALKENNLQVLAFFLPRMRNITGSYNFSSIAPLKGLFDEVLQLAESIEEKEKKFEGKVFSWRNVVFSKEDLYAIAINLIYDDQKRLERILENFDQLSLGVRESLTRTVLKDFYSYSYSYINRDENNAKVTNFQRNFAVKVIKDRGESITASAINTLSRVELRADEIDQIKDLFKRKGAALRKNLIALILKQKDAVVTPFVEDLTQNGDVEQRLAGLDMLLQLKKGKRATAFINNAVQVFKERPKISVKEEDLLKQLDPKTSDEILSTENGYGLYDPKKITEYALPTLAKDSVYIELTNKNKYGFSKPLDKIKKDLEALNTLYISHQNHEYQYEEYGGSMTTTLLANDFEQLKRDTNGFTPAQFLENYPLSEVWDKWYHDSGLQPIDLFLLTFQENGGRKDFQKFLEKYVFYFNGVLPNPFKNAYLWRNPVYRILMALKAKYPIKDENDFFIDATAQLYKDLPKDIINYKYKKGKNDYYHYTTYGDGWQNESSFDVYLNAVNIVELSDEQALKLWNIYRWRQFNGLPENIAYNKAPLYLYCRMYEQGKISKDELYDGLLEPDRINVVTSKTKHYRHAGSEDLLANFTFLQEIVDEVREKFLDVEIKRGDSSTPVTHFVQSFDKIYGVNRFVELLEKLGKTKLYKGYIYSWSYTDVTKQRLFSYLIKRCMPLSSDTQEEFNKLIKDAKIPDDKLVEAAVYAPQWQKFVSSYLGWKGLDAAIWWMHAHTKTTGYQAVNAELESEVAKYSSIDIQDYQDGAVDKDWFVAAYKELGKARWEVLYEAAKYVSDGNGHRRARLYADTLTGDLKIREVTAKVKDKRDQDYLRVYGLVPLSKANPEKDVLSRYEYLQQFKKESREFGSMKQSSEALAIRIAMENLARNAGYPDPIRLTWAMETQQVQSILAKNTQVEIEGTVVGLIIEEDGKAEVVAFKGDKMLKAIPPKLKKSKEVVELLQYRKILREQFSRSRKGFEEAMVRGDEFMLAEIANLFQHPVISKHLEKLVFISSDNKIGFYHDGSLIDADGVEHALGANETLRIAHSVDLHEHKVWTAFQHLLFEKKLIQPFKQVFRELYIPTADELKEKSISRRYAGHQVQPNKTLALLKTRGWKVDYEEGLQKVFHKEGFQVKLYAMADWFSPADVESPTLETIEFHSLKTHKNIPLKDINPRIFSEVMRDVDLVVSVAHVGGVDPEASQSSIEMRAVLLTETLRLFKLNNVKIEGNHAIVKGSLGDYSVHLGSAVVHQLPGLHLSILPVHSQHRGRLFLPFADDDPKSAELISKVLLLAKDNEIKDPTILSQLKREI